MPYDPTTGEWYDDAGMMPPPNPLNVATMGGGPVMPPPMPPAGIAPGGAAPTTPYTPGPKVTDYQNREQQLQDLLAKQAAAPGWQKGLRTLGGVATQFFLGRRAPGAAAEIAQNVEHPGVSARLQQLGLAKQSANEERMNEAMLNQAAYRRAIGEARAQNAATQANARGWRPMPPPNNVPLTGLQDIPAFAGATTPMPAPLPPASIESTVRGQKGFIPPASVIEQEKKQTDAQAARDARQAQLDQFGIPTPAAIKKAFPTYGDKILPDELPKLEAAAVTANKLNLLQTTNPDDLQSTVDKIVDKKKAPELNARTHTLVAAALAEGDVVAAKDAVKAAAKEISATETAVATAKATSPIKIYTAGQTQAAQTAAGFSDPGGTAGQNLTGEDYLATLPRGLQKTVKAIAEGRQAPITGFAMTRGPGAQIMNAVNHYDPQWSAQRAEIRKAFTTGTDGKNIGALNTATVHLDQLSDAIQALNNGTFQPGNAAYNYFKTIFGKAPPTNYAALSAAVSGEMAAALKGNATDVEIATMKKNMNDAQSPEQGLGAIDTNLHILGAKMSTYQQRYSQQIPGDKVWSPVLPAARSVFVKHGFDPTAATPPPSQGGIKVTDPNGGIHTFPDQASADRFKQLAGIK